jgi:hypothetical protein
MDNRAMSPMTALSVVVLSLTTIVIISCERPQGETFNRSFELGQNEVRLPTIAMSSEAVAESDEGNNAYFLTDHPSGLSIAIVSRRLYVNRKYFGDVEAEQLIKIRNEETVLVDDEKRDGQVIEEIEESWLEFMRHSAFHVLNHKFVFLPESDANLYARPVRRTNKWEIHLGDEKLFAENDRIYLTEDRPVQIPTGGKIGVLNVDEVFRFYWSDGEVKRETMGHLKRR